MFHLCLLSKSFTITDLYWLLKQTGIDWTYPYNYFVIFTSTWKTFQTVSTQKLKKTFLFRTRVTKIQYLASSRGSLITPKSHTPPSKSAINDEFQKCCDKGQQHLATVFIQPLYFYSQGVRVTIDKPAKDIKLDDVKRQLKSNYMSSLKGLYL